MTLVKLCNIDRTMSVEAAGTLLDPKACTKEQYTDHTRLPQEYALLSAAKAYEFSLEKNHQIFGHSQNSPNRPT